MCIAFYFLHVSSELTPTRMRMAALATSKAKSLVIRRLSSLGEGKEIGRGACEVVHEGKWNRRTVIMTVKKMHPRLWDVIAKYNTSPSAWLDCFSRPAFILKQLSHPNIVQIFEILELQEESAVIAIEWLDHTLVHHLELAIQRLVLQPATDRHVSTDSRCCPLSSLTAAASGVQQFDCEDCVEILPCIHRHRLIHCEFKL